jgi:hypothetical protein
VLFRSCTALVLAYQQPRQRFVLDINASNVGIGGVLSQIQDGQERVMTYYSKTMNKAERNYCVTWRELLATVRMLEHSTSTSMDKSSTCTQTTLC